MAVSLCRDLNSDQRSGDKGHLVDLLGVAAAGQVVDGGVQALQDGAVGLEAAQTLCNLIADVAGVDVGEDEGVGIACDLGAGSLQLADLGSNGSRLWEIAVLCIFVLLQVI